MTIRLQRKRTAGARLPEGTLYAGRPTLFGNPWTGPGAIEAYKRFLDHVLSGVLAVGVIEDGLDVDLVFRKPIDRWQEFRRWLFDLRRDPPNAMACYCSLDRPCHVDQIIEALTRSLKLEGEK